MRFRLINGRLHELHTPTNNMARLEYGKRHWSTGILIDAVDPNVNFVHIATVTTNATGNFGATWTPQAPGDYKISASFAGSNSYGASWAETYATVAAPHATSTPTPPASAVNADSATDVMTYIAAAAIAIIIAVAIVGILILRKK